MALVALTLLSTLLAVQPQQHSEAEPAPVLPPRFERWTDTEVELPLLSLTVSGGVSLGSYEAGYLYYLMLAAKLNPQLLDTRIFTGASAGSLNALLALMSSCSKPNFRADDNLFFNAWMPIGAGALMQKDKTTPISIFTQQPLSRVVELTRTAWTAGLDTSCDVMLGVTTTRVTAQAIDLVGGRVSLPRTEAKFSLHVKGMGPGVVPKLTNYANPLDPMGRPLLPTNDDGQIEFDSLAQVLLASAAFPLAFSPQPISHCIAPGVLAPGDSPLASPRCTTSRAVTALFYDGGVFDNQPLRLAVHLASRGFFREGAIGRWRPVPDFNLVAIPRDAVFLYMDPDTDVLPELASHDHPPLDGMVSYGLYLASQLVGSVRTKELQALLEDSPGVKRQIGTTLTYFRPLSSSLRNFFGLFERDIRVHDYYLGMHDAARFVDDVLVPWSGSKTLVRPETVAARGETAVAFSWQPFVCMRAVFDGIGDIKSCELITHNVRVAMQVTLDTLYARCAQVFDEAIKEGLAAPGTTHEHCRRAMAGKGPPKVPGLIAEGNWKYATGGEDSFDHQLRRLNAYGFTYHDLGLDEQQAKYARRKIARTINDATNGLAAKQQNGTLVATLGRTASQYLSYVPPDHALSFLFGTRFEAAWSFTRGQDAFNWVRLNAALGIEGITTALGAPANRFLMLTPKLGVEFEPTFLSGLTLQWRLGARAGFQFSTHDGFSSVGCDSRLPCSRAVVEPFVAVSLFQWVRGQLGFDLLPPMRGLPTAFEFRPSIGAEVDLP